MADYNFKNNLKTTLQAKLWNDATAISCNHVVTSEDAATRLAAWPAFPFTLTLVDTATDALEIVKCTGLVSNFTNVIVFDCTRAQESTTAQTFEVATTSVEHRLTASALNTVFSDVSELDSLIKDAQAMHVGSIISVLANDTYVPTGCAPCDGAEYTRAQFPVVYDSYLTGATPKLLTCTYAEYATQIGLTGNCGKFAVDAANQKFKVPMLKDGDSITHAASAAELGKSVKAGLPDIQGYIGVAAQVTGSGAFTASGTYGGYGTLDNTPNTASFKASSWNAIYGNSTTVTDEQVRLRHFVVLASAQTNASQFDWSTYMSGLQGKVNLDVDNLTQVGTTAIAHYAMPSARYTDMSLTWGSTYTAPSDGFFNVFGTATAATQARLQVYAPDGVTLISRVGTTVQNGTVWGLEVPARKGDKCVPFGDAAANGWRFTYANGAY